MARAIHRLALLVLPEDPEVSPELLDALVAELVTDGLLDGGASGMWAPGIVPMVAGGFRRARIERFPRVRFVSSGLGGFSVRCPVNGQNVVTPFIEAFSTWTAGGPRILGCPCGEEHDLARLVFSPEAGFARAWLELQEVESADLEPEALARVARGLGGARIVARRG